MQYQDLLSTLLETRAQAPAVGSPVSPRVEKSATQIPKAVAGPVRILGIIVDEVGKPRNDGTRGSALYSVPFRLSRAVSPVWAQTFKQTWDTPHQWTPMHRPGIARVYHDRIVLEGTTIEEVQKYHRDTLILCVEETNRLVGEHERHAMEEEARRTRESEEHRKRVQDLSDQIDWG